MAHYFIFPEKDSTIFSHPSEQTTNAGIDEILSIQSRLSNLDGNHFPSRALIQFKQSEIDDVINNIVWIYDMDRDYFVIDNLKLKKTPILTQHSYIVVNKDSDTFLHNHIDEYDLHNSPDLTALIPIVGDKDSFIEFFYESGRKRHMRQRVNLFKEEIILFNSELKHRLIINKLHKNLVFLSLKMQLIS